MNMRYLIRGLAVALGVAVVSLAAFASTLLNNSITVGLLALTSALFGLLISLLFSRQASAKPARKASPLPSLADLRALEPEPSASPSERQRYADLICSMMQSTELDAETRSSSLSMLLCHLRNSGSSYEFWPGIDVKLAGSTLERLDLSRCTMRRLDLEGSDGSRRSVVGRRPR